MTSRDFCYWLQGYFEIAEKIPTPADGFDGLNSAQTAAIKRHLAMVFVHEIDPSFGGPEKQAKLDAAHKRPETSAGDPNKLAPISVSELGGTGPGPTGILYRC